MKIGEVSKAAGVGIDAIRFYEREGLIPAPARRPSGYREYTPDVVVSLRFIRRAKELGSRGDPRQSSVPFRVRGRCGRQARGRALGHDAAPIAGARPEDAGVPHLVHAGWRH